MAFFCGIGKSISTFLKGSHQINSKKYKHIQNSLKILNLGNPRHFSTLNSPRNPAVNAKTNNIKENVSLILGKKCYLSYLVITQTKINQNQELKSKRQPLKKYLQYISSSQYNYIMHIYCGKCFEDSGIVHGLYLTKEIKTMCLNA